jgi:hypothetical protein
VELCSWFSVLGWVLGSRFWALENRKDEIKERQVEATPITTWIGELKLEKQE